MSFNQFKSTKVFGTFQNSNFTTGTPNIAASAVFDGSVNIIGDTTITKLKINSGGVEKASQYYDDVAKRNMYVISDPSSNGWFFQNNSGVINAYLNTGGSFICTALQGNTLYCDSGYSPAFTAANLQIDTNLIANLGATQVNISPTELSYLDNVSSNIQTQLNSKGALSSANTWSSTNTFTGNIVANSLTISPTELSYLDNVTSNIQTQLNGKGSLSGANTWSGVNTITNNIIANSLTISPIELSYLDGVTSNIQTQLNSISSVSLSGNNVFTGNNTFNNIFSNNSMYFKADGTQSLYMTSILGQIGGTGNDSYTRFFGLNNTTYLDFNQIIKFRACDLSGNVTGTIYEFNSNGQFYAPITVTDNLGITTNLYVDSTTISPTELSYLDNVSSNIQTQLNNKITKNTDASMNNVDIAGSLNVGVQFYSPDILCNSLGVATNIVCGYPTPIASISYQELSYLDGVTSNIQTQLNNTISLSTNNVFTGNNTFNNIYSNNSHYFKADGTQSIYFTENLGVIGGASNMAYTRIFASPYTTYIDFFDEVKIRACDPSGNLVGFEFQFYSNGEFFSNYVTTNEIRLSTMLIVNSTNISPTELSYLDNVSSNIQSQLNGKAQLSVANTFTANNTFNNLYSNNSHYFKSDGTQSIYFTSVLGQIGGVGNTSYSRMFALGNTSYLDFNQVLKIRACDLSGNTTGAVFEYNTNGQFYSPSIQTTDLFINNTINANSIAISAAELSYLDGASSNIQQQITDISGNVPRLNAANTFTGVNTLSNTLKTTSDIYLKSNSGGYYSTPNALPAAIGNTTFMHLFSSSQNTYFDYGNLNLFFRPVEAHNGSPSISNKITFNQYANIDAPSMTTQSLTISSSITLPNNSISDAALSTNVPFLNLANNFTSFINTFQDISCNNVFTYGKNINTLYISKNYWFDTISGAITLTEADTAKQFQVTGTSVFTITIPFAYLYPGVNYTFFVSNTGAAYPNYISLVSGNGNFSGFTPSTQQGQTTTYKLYQRTHITVRSNGTSWIVDNGSYLDLYPNNFYNFGNTTLKGNLSVDGTITLPNNSIADTALSTNIPELNANQTFTGTNNFTTQTYGDSSVKAATTEYVDNAVLKPVTASYLTTQTMTASQSNKTFTLGGSTTFTITLPAASGNDGVHYTFINTRSTAVADISITSTSGNIFVNNTNEGLTYSMPSGVTQTFISNNSKWYMTNGGGNDINNKRIVTNSITLPNASIADAYLTSNVPLLNASQTFSAANTFSSSITAGNHYYFKANGAASIYCTPNALPATTGNTVYMRQFAVGDACYVDYGNGSYIFRPANAATGGVVSTYNTTLDNVGRLTCFGTNGRQGTAGFTLSNFYFNHYWTGTALQCWLNTTNQGNFTISDKRIKENFQQPSNVLDRLCSIPMCNYEWKNTGIFKKNGITHLGFFAHDLQDTFPELNGIVEGDRDAMTSDGFIQPQTISAEFVNVLMKSIQELNEKVEKLSNRIIDLESKISS